MADNQNPEQKARDHIDMLLKQAGWTIQSMKMIDLSTGQGQAVREYQTDAGPADYVLFVDKKAIGVIEAKREEESQAKKEQLDEEDNPPTVTGQSSSQAASDSFGQGSSAKTDAALGELTSDQKLAPPRPKKLPPPPKRARMTAKASSGSGGNDVSNDPILALNMKRLEEVNKKDSPGRLHQLLAESLEQQDSNAFDW